MKYPRSGMMNVVYRGIYIPVSFFKKKSLFSKFIFNMKKYYKIIYEFPKRVRERSVR